MINGIVATIAKNPVDSAIKAKQLGADILEFRIDLMRGEYDKLKDIKKLGLPVIITNRMKQEGGAWDGTEEERIHTLLSLLPLADAVDIELQAKERDKIVENAKKMNKTVIISHHDFQKTPEHEVMHEIIHKCFEAGADIAKLAVMPNSLKDVLCLFEVLLQVKGKVCLIAMGDLGKHSRAIAPIYGSVMTYGYIDKAVAPGQLRVDELKSVLSLLRHHLS